jgi:hypothetical protein
MINAHFPDFCLKIEYNLAIQAPDGEWENNGNVNVATTIEHTNIRSLWI